MLLRNNCFTKYDDSHNYECGSGGPLQAGKHYSNGVKFKLKQNMNKEIELLSPTFQHIASPNHQSPYQYHNQPYNHYQHTFSPHSLDNSPTSFDKQIKSSTSQANCRSQNNLQFTTQLYEDSWQNESDINDTGEIMDGKFDQLLQMNLNDNNFTAQPKFIILKSQKTVKDLQIHLKESEQHNTHEKLLEQENGYLRDQLIQFSEVQQQQKLKYTELKMANKMTKKENNKLKRQLRTIQEYKKNLQAQLYKSEENYSNLFNKYQQQQSYTQKINRINQQLSGNLKVLERQYYILQQRKQKREKHIESIEYQKQRLKQEYTYLLSLKEKQISQLNEALSQLKQKSKHNITDDSSQEAKNLSDSKLFQDGTNSICLSLAEAESLKNIIEQKQELHKAEIMMLKKHHHEAQQSLLKELQTLKAKISSIESLSVHCQQGLKKKQQEYLLYWDGMKEEEKSEYFGKEIKRLYRQLFEANSKKEQLQNYVCELYQRCSQRQEDDQVQDLLQNCVQQLQKSRKLNFILTNQNNYLKTLFCNNQKGVNPLYM